MADFRVETTPQLATLNGLFGHQPDIFERHVPGVTRYFVDEVEVPFEEFERRYRAAGGGVPPLGGGGGGGNDSTGIVGNEHGGGPNY